MYRVSFRVKIASGTGNEDIQPVEHTIDGPSFVDDPLLINLEPSRRYPFSFGRRARYGRRKGQQAVPKLIALAEKIKDISNLVVR